MFPEDTRQLYRLFADVLDYPDSSSAGVAEECLQKLEISFPDSAKPMRTFVDYTHSQSLGTLEEVYTKTFDTVPDRTLYVGYQLFGENPKRSTFLVRLEEAFQAQEFSRGSELADHLPVLLRFLSVAEEPEFAIPLLQECLLPVLDKIEGDFKKDKTGYGASVRSLKRFLKTVSGSLEKTGGLAG
ncbi:MAG: molecular chaperone TorD family protein [Dehalococcoidales bacterium]